MNPQCCCALPWCGASFGTPSHSREFRVDGKMVKFTYPSMIEMHDMQRRSQGGDKFDLDNNVPLCKECHTKHHDGRCTLEFDDEGYVRSPQHGWDPLVVFNEFNQDTVPFSEPTEDEGDKLHELSAKLTQAAETASTLDYVVGSILNSIAPYVSTEELYDMVEEAFGIARTSTPSFISRRRKVARLDERYADLGMSKMLALLDAAEKTEYPVEHLEPELRALSTSDFRIRYGLKKEPAPKHACPDCGKLHVCASTSCAAPKEE